MATAAFAGRVEKAGKASRGRTARETTPVAIRSRVTLPAGFDDQIRDELASKLGHAATLIERGTVRFEDVNGPRGGVDIVCRIKLVLSGRPSVQVEEKAATPKAAFARARAVLVRALARVRDKHDLRASSRSKSARTPARTPARTSARRAASTSRKTSTKASPRAARAGTRRG
ncbi:MAG TPA: hypothetical protein VK932_21735 [Kofleriaceae bacterium]|nr:hypothetical protein [Kofleriaceae bacterium]